MVRYIIARHFIDGEETLEECRVGMNSLRKAMALSRENGYQLKFGLKLTVDGKNIERGLQEMISDEVRRFPPEMWLLVDSMDRGPGTSLRQVLFNPTFISNDPGIVVNLDLDQYVADTEESLCSLKELVDKVERDESLFSNGSRDVPVVLATNKRNSDLRIIHELFHSLTIGSQKLKAGGGGQDVTPAYDEIGESTSGLYLMNIRHPSFPELAKHVLVAVQSANMDGFAMDYYVAIRAAELGTTSTGYVKARKNKFHCKSDESEELGSVRRLILGQSRELGKTDVKYSLSEAVGDETNSRRIAEFYPRGDVDLVRGLMLEGLLS